MKWAVLVALCAAMLCGCASPKRTMKSVVAPALADVESFEPLVSAIQSAKSNDEQMRAIYKFYAAFDEARKKFPDLEYPRFMLFKENQKLLLPNEGAKEAHFVVIVAPNKGPGVVLPFLFELKGSGAFYALTVR